MQKKNKHNLKGFIEHVHANSIAGWVVRAGQKTPVWVELWINGQKIQGQQAKGHRKDILKANLHANGNCGYHFGNLEPLKREDKIVVKAGKEQWSLPWTERAKTNKKHLPKTEGPSQLIPTDKGYFFVHIPKTAGTSFRMMLYDLFAPSEIIPNVFDIEKNGGSYPKIHEVLEQKDEHAIKLLRLMAGHYPYRPTYYFEHKPQTMVFLRDPFQRAVSNLFHLKRRNPRFFNSSFEEIYEQSQRQLVNMQVRYISGHYVKHPLDGADLAVAKANLRSFAFIGITEQFNESIDYVEQLFDWKFPELLVRNVNKSLTTDDLSPELIEKLKASNELDQKLYELGVQLLKERITTLKKNELVS